MPQGDLKYAMDSGWSGGTGGGKVDPLAPKPGVKVRLRTADLFAWKLSEIVGAPLFELYWPEARRDQGLAEMTAFLAKYGDRLGPFAAHQAREARSTTDLPYPRAHHQLRASRPPSVRPVKSRPVWRSSRGKATARDTSSRCPIGRFVLGGSLSKTSPGFNNRSTRKLGR